jgi:Ca2+-binding RTX toxin-like protein
VLLGGPAATPNNFNITVSDAFTGAGLTRTVFATAVTTALVIDGTAEADGNLKIYGGQAADVLTGGAGNDLIFGNLGADTLRGNAGIDTFLYDAAAQSTSTAYDRLVDFNYGTDLIKISGQVHDSYALVGSGTLSTATFDSDLATALNADLTGGKAVFFTPNVGALSGSAFLVIDANGIDGYQAGQDYVFEVPNPPPVLPPADFIIP